MTVTEVVTKMYLSGVCVPYETSGISDDDQPEQKNKDLHQPLVQIPGEISNVTVLFVEG